LLFTETLTDKKITKMYGKEARSITDRYCIKNN